MMYGSVVWSNTTKQNLDRISKLQKRAARTILGVSTRERSIPLFEKRGWIPFIDEVKIRKAMICHNRLYGSCPSYITDLLPTNSELHERRTRYSELTNCQPRIKRKKEGGRSFSVSIAET